VRIAIWRKFRVGEEVIWTSVPWTERMEDESERRDRKRDKNVWAGRIFGGV
jgi:hypothetical protein